MNIRIKKLTARPKIYIAGKLNDKAVNYLHNVHRMMEVAENVRQAGFSVFVPCIDLLMGIKFGYTHYTQYFDNSIAWLVASDGMCLVDGWETSEGTSEEINIANNFYIPIFKEDEIEKMKKHFNL